MRKVLVVLLVLVVAAVALGFYRGWFSFAQVRDPNSGQTEVRFGIDENKAKKDAQNVKEKITPAPKEQPKEK
jgi:hypothetical protein